jgi:hypothetical protein
MDDMRNLRIDASVEPMFKEGEDLTMTFDATRNVLKLKINLETQYKVLACRNIFIGVLKAELEKLVEQHIQYHAGEEERKGDDMGNLMIIQGPRP